MKGEAWQFGIEQGQIQSYLDARGFSLVEQLDAAELEKRFMRADDGTVLGRISGTHCIAEAESCALEHRWAHTEV